MSAGVLLIDIRVAVFRMLPQKPEKKLRMKKTTDAEDEGMIAVIQRVSSAQVSVDDKIAGQLKTC